jgi:hypothetical protein
MGQTSVSTFLSNLLAKKITHAFLYQPENEIIRIGVLQTERPDLDDYSFTQEDGSTDILQPPPLQSWLLRNDYSDLLSSPIWAHPSLRLVTSGFTQAGNSEHLSHDVHDEVVPYQALIWAKNQRELRNLKRLSRYVAIGGNLSGWEDGQKFERPIHDLCGIRADFTPEYNAGQRSIG